MSETTVVAAEASAAAIGAKFTAGGGMGGAASFWLGFNWLGWMGVGIAIAGLLVNAYFSYQRDKREKTEHRERMKKYNGECKIEDQK